GGRADPNAQPELCQTPSDLVPTSAGVQAGYTGIDFCGLGLDNGEVSGTNQAKSVKLSWLRLPCRPGRPSACPCSPRPGWEVNQTVEKETDMETPRMPTDATFKVTFQIVDGIDKGRLFRDLVVPFTIGREEGNLLRLNDERVSRYHAKVQQDAGDLILTDLESTNGTRVNGHVVQIRRLRFGDRIALGRSLLLFGSDEEINARRATLRAGIKSLLGGALGGVPAQQGPPTLHANPMAGKAEGDC